MAKMSLFEQVKNKRFAPGSGVAKLPPVYGAKRFFFVSGIHFWKLVQLNLLFLLFCIPVVTIPAAFCGMNRVLIKLTREGNCFLWNDFIKEFKRCFFKSIPFGSLFAFFVFDSLLAYNAGVAGESASIGYLALAFCLLGVTVMFFGYVFVFLASLDLKNKQIVKNAFIFMLTEWKANIAIIGSVLISAGIMVLSVFVSLVLTFVLLIFIYFSFAQLAVCVVVNRPMEKRIIAPYEESKKDGKA